MKTNQIRVSVIVPTFNRAQMLLSTLNSLCEQDFPKELFEIVIVDNNSNDNTYDAVSEFAYGPGVKLNLKYIIEKRAGDVYARHTGAYHAEGEILFFTDDDATFDHNWISKTVNIFERFPVGAVGTRILIKWDHLPDSWVFRFESLMGKISYGEGITIKSKGLFINNGSLAIKKEIFRLVGGNNPGQVNDYLVGNAEVGLCMKLHEKSILIGFTDETTMWHHQLASKNGTLHDIVRRYKNNGKADAYQDMFVLGKSKVNSIRKELLIHAFSLLSGLITLRKSRVLNAFLELNQILSRHQYNYKLKTDPAISELINKQDWIFDENYKGSEIILQNRIS
jgi:glucosyl-dolichyl phosphate glucuronosyltransferase